MAAPNPLRLAYARRFPAEMARMLATQGDDAVAAGFDGLPAESLAALVAHLPRGHARRVLERQDDKTVGEWLDRSALDNALAIARQLDDEHRTRVLESVPTFTRREALKRLLIYPRTTAGAAADPTAPRLDAALTLDDARKQLHDEQPEAERAIWLVDAQGCLVGLLDATRALAASSGHRVLSDLAIVVRPLHADTTLANVLDYPEWNRHSELPVVDHLNHFLGSLPHERLLAALGDDVRPEAGLGEVVGDLTQQYFRVMSSVLGELFSKRGARR